MKTKAGYKNIACFVHNNWTPLWSEILPFAQADVDWFTKMLHGMGTIAFREEESWKAKPDVKLTHFFLYTWPVYFFREYANRYKDDEKYIKWRNEWEPVNNREYGEDLEFANKCIFFECRFKDFQYRGIAGHQIEIIQTRLNYFVSIALEGRTSYWKCKDRLHVAHCILIESQSKYFK